MKIVVLAVMGFVMWAAALQAQDAEQKNAEAYILACERQWAEDTVSGKTENVERFLADDFVGVDPSGKYFDKAKEIESLQKDAGHFVSNHLNEAKVRFFGDTAVAQGSESWVEKNADGSERRGTFVWTDTWVKRDGKWQIVAAQDGIARE